MKREEKINIYLHICLNTCYIARKNLSKYGGSKFPKIVTFSSFITFFFAFQLKKSITSRKLK